MCQFATTRLTEDGGALQDKGFDRAVVKVSPATAGSWSDSRVSPLSAGSLEYKPVAVRCRAQWLRLSAAMTGQ
jgi:hypothetical protein